MPTIKFEPKGVMPACLLPFAEDLSIDEAAYRSHLDDLAGVRGVTAITVNGHAAEVSSCTFQEQERLMAVSAEQVAGKVPLICGIYSESSLEAARLARMAERNGASALLVFPPFIFGRGARLRPDMAVCHYQAVASATDLPLVIFQYALSGIGYGMDTLQRLVEKVPSICAMKDFSGEPAFHERAIRTLRNGAARPIAILTTHSSWLLSSLVLGCDGLLSGSGSTIAPLQVELFDAVRQDDMPRARAVADRIYHWTRVIYTEPHVDAHSRMKEALVMLGRMPRATVRPPLLQIPEPERQAIRGGLRAAGLLS